MNIFDPKIVQFEADEARLGALVQQEQDPTRARAAQAELTFVRKRLRYYRLRYRMGESRPRGAGQWGFLPTRYVAESAV